MPAQGFRAGHNFLAEEAGMSWQQMDDTDMTVQSRRTGHCFQAEVALVRLHRHMEGVHMTGQGVRHGHDFLAEKALSWQPLFARKVLQLARHCGGGRGGGVSVGLTSSTKGKCLFVRVSCLVAAI